MTLKQIADLIGLGTAKSAKSELRQWGKEKNDDTTATLPLASNYWNLMGTGKNFGVIRFYESYPGGIGHGF